MEKAVEALECALFVSSPIGVVNTLPLGKFLRQHRPLASCFNEVADGVDDGAAVMFWFGVKEGFDRLPLGVSQIGAIRHRYEVLG